MISRKKIAKEIVENIINELSCPKCGGIIYYYISSRQSSAYKIVNSEFVRKYRSVDDVDEYIECENNCDLRDYEKFEEKIFKYADDNGIL